MKKPTKVTRKRLVLAIRRIYGGNPGGSMDEGGNWLRETFIKCAGSCGIQGDNEEDAQVVLDFFRHMWREYKTESGPR